MTKRCKKNRCGDRNRLFKWWNSFNEELSCDFNHLLMMRWKMNSTSSWPFCFLFRICSYLVGVEKKIILWCIRHNTTIILNNLFVLSHVLVWHLFHKYMWDLFSLSILKKKFLFLFDTDSLYCRNSKIVISQIHFLMRLSNGSQSSRSMKTYKMNNGFFTLLIFKRIKF